MNKKRIHQDESPIVKVLSNPFGAQFKEICSVLNESEAKDVYEYLYSHSKKVTSRTIWPIHIEEMYGVKKYLFQLLDGNHIETVTIKRRTGFTVCVSTQVGCGVRCVFCESGKYGLKRNLSVSEIVQQVIFVEENINRIVFMGMGEPLHNYESVIGAIHILRDRNGLNFPTDGITISTVGPLCGLKKLREEHIKIQLVLSLHATTQSTRDYLIPGIKGNDINECVKAVLSYGFRHRRIVTIAYALVDGVNDKDSDIKQLIEWFKTENVIINLLPVNSSSSKRNNIFSNNTNLIKFKKSLEDASLQVTIREHKGKEINAACGQLSGKYNKK